MTPEFWTIVGVGVSLFAFGVAALQFTFRRLDQRFADTNKLIDQRFNAVDKRFDDVNRRIDDTNKLVDQRFNDVNKRIDDTNRRMDQRFDDINRRMDGLSSDVKQLTSRVTELEKGQVGVQVLLNGLREDLSERAGEGAGTSSD